MGNKRNKATVSKSGGIVIGACDVIKWDDIMNIQGTDVEVSKAVELGLKWGIPIAEKLEKDLKGKGLFITFPMMFLMSALQEKLEKEGEPHETAGQKILEMVKP